MACSAVDYCYSSVLAHGECGAPSARGLEAVAPEEPIQVHAVDSSGHGGLSHPALEPEHELLQIAPLPRGLRATTRFGVRKGVCQRRRVRAVNGRRVLDGDAP